MLHDARLRLAEATGGAALCRIGPEAGEGRPAVKRAEGAAAALADLRDALRRQGDPDAALEHVYGQWTADLQSHRTRGSGTEWVAYCEGGVAAIDQAATSWGRSPAWRRGPCPAAPWGTPWSPG